MACNGIAITLTPVTDDDGIHASSSPTVAGALAIDGILASGGVVELASPHLVTVTSGGNDTGITFTITGTDGRGNSVTDTFAGASGAAATSSRYFKRITGASNSAAAASTVKVGVAGKAATPWITTSPRHNPRVGFSVNVVSGTLTYEVQHVIADMSDSTINLDALAGVHNSVTAKTADADGSYDSPISALRLVTTAFTSGSAEIRAVQNRG